MQQTKLARRPIVMDRRLDHGAGVIDIVLLIIIAAVQPPAMGRFLQLGVGVEIAIGVPRGRGADPLDITIQARLENWVSLGGQEIGAAADHFVDQPVIPRRPAMCPAFALADFVEVGQRPVFLELGETVGNGHLPPDFAFGGPEVVLDDDLLDGERGEGRSFCFARLAGHTGQHEQHHTETAPNFIRALRP